MHQHGHKVGSGSTTPIEKELLACRTIFWLRENYRLGRSGSLAKEEVYADYLKSIEPNPAAPLIIPTYFGKLVKKAFPTLRCNRKGPRGKAKQHYTHLQRVDHLREAERRRFHISSLLSNCSPELSQIGHFSEPRDTPKSDDDQRQPFQSYISSELSYLNYLLKKSESLHSPTSERSSLDDGRSDSASSLVGFHGPLSLLSTSSNDPAAPAMMDKQDEKDWDWVFVFDSKEKRKRTKSKSAETKSHIKTSRKSDQRIEGLPCATNRQYYPDTTNTCGSGCSDNKAARYSPGRHSPSLPAPLKSRKVAELVAPATRELRPTFPDNNSLRSYSSGSSPISGTEVPFDGGQALCKSAGSFGSYWQESNSSDMGPFVADSYLAVHSSEYSLNGLRVQSNQRYLDSYPQYHQPESSPFRLQHQQAQAMFGYYGGYHSSAQPQPTLLDGRTRSNHMLPVSGGPEPQRFDHYSTTSPTCLAS